MGPSHAEDGARGAPDTRPVSSLATVVNLLLAHPSNPAESANTGKFLLGGTDE